MGKILGAVAALGMVGAAEADPQLVGSNVPKLENVPGKTLTVEGEEASAGIVEITREELGKMMKSTDGAEISVPTLEQLELPELSTLNESDYAPDVWKKINFYYKILAGMNNSAYLAKVEEKGLTDKVIAKYDSLEEELEASLPLLVNYGVSKADLETVLDDGAELAAVKVPPMESLNEADYDPEVWKVITYYYDLITKVPDLLENDSFVEKKKEEGTYETLLKQCNTAKVSLKNMVQDGKGGKTAEEMKQIWHERTLALTKDLVASAEVE